MVFRLKDYIIICSGMFLSVSLLAEVPRLKEATDLYRQGKFEDSLNVVRSIFEEHKGVYEVRLLAGSNHARLGNTDSSIQHLRAAIKEHPDRIEARGILSVILRNNGKYKESVAVARSGLEKKPDDEGLHLEVARGLIKLGEYAAARKSLDRIIAKNAHHFEAVLLDGLIYLRQKNYDNAEFRLRNALKIRPEKSPLLADLYNNLAFALEKIGDVHAKTGNTAQAKTNYAEAGQFYTEALKAEDIPAIKENQARLQKKL